MDRQAVISALPRDGFAVGLPENRRRIRKVVHWFELRSVLYICCRLVALLQRYGLTASRAKRRTLDCVDTLARYDCRPTFPTPGQVVHRNGVFCRELQRRGAELAIHGYHHLDFRALSADEARTQFARAASAYERNGIQPEGFRCPYLSYVERVNRSLPPALEYSSNKAIEWDVNLANAPRRTGNGARAVFEGLSRFYQAVPSRTHVSVPSMAGHRRRNPGEFARRPATAGRTETRRASHAGGVDRSAAPDASTRRAVRRAVSSGIVRSVRTGSGGGSAGGAKPPTVGLGDAASRHQSVVARKVRLRGRHLPRRCVGAAGVPMFRAGYRSHSSCRHQRTRVRVGWIVSRPREPDPATECVGQAAVRRRGGGPG